MFSEGITYRVEQAEDGKLVVMCDCGFYASTSASLFIFAKDMPLEAPESASEQLNGIVVEQHHFTPYKAPASRTVRMNTCVDKIISS
jgi:hypothetical protein